MRCNRFVFPFLAVLLLLFTGTVSSMARVACYNSTSFRKDIQKTYYQRIMLETRIGLFANGNPVNRTDPTGRLSKGMFQETAAQVSNLSGSVGDTAFDTVAGGLSLLSSAMGYGMNLMGMPAHHLHAQAASISKRLSSYARSGYYDPNSVVATAVTAGSILAVPFTRRNDGVLLLSLDKPMAGPTNQLPIVLVNQRMSEAAISPGHPYDNESSSRLAHAIAKLQR